MSEEINIVDTLIRLHEENPLECYDWFFNKPLDEYLKVLKKEPPKNLTYISLNDYKHKSELSRILAFLPPKLLYKELGEQAYLWTWINYGFTGKSEKLLNQISELTSYNRRDIETARLFVWQNNPSLYKVETILKVYDKIQNLNNIFKNQNFLDYFLKESNEGIIPEHKIRKYRFQTNNYKHSSYIYKNNKEKFEKTYPIFCDSPLILILDYKNKPTIGFKPSAIIGFQTINTNTIKINQIQGIRPEIRNLKTNEKRYVSSRGIMHIDWHRLLVNSVINIAKNIGMKKIIITSGLNNKWYHRRVMGKHNLPLKRALKNYDNVAERLGFKQEKNKNWIKEL